MPDDEYKKIILNDRDGVSCRSIDCYSISNTYSDEQRSVKSRNNNDDDRYVKQCYDKHQW